MTVKVKTIFAILPDNPIMTKQMIRPGFFKKIHISLSLNVICNEEENIWTLI